MESILLWRIPIDAGKRDGSAFGVSLTLPPA
jgi:hypothetical protein